MPPAKKKKLRNTPAGIAARAAGRRALLDGLVAEMHAYYQRGHSLSATGRRYGRSPSAVRSLFGARRLAIRPAAFRLAPRDPRTGRPLPATPLTPEQIEHLIATTPVLRVPAPLRLDWRKWSLERRADFIRRLRARLASPLDRPAGPFSADLEPFDYGSARAHAIVAALNHGLDSRAAVSKIDICSQGVIRDGRLWFWSRKSDGYFSGHWTAEHRRPSLHHFVWAEHHGRPVPPGHVLSFADGNRNNLAPANLILRTRDDVARVNQAAALAAKSREAVALLLDRSRSASFPETEKNHGHHTHTLRLLRGRR